MAAVELDRLTVRHGRTAALRDVTMSVPDGAFVAVVGASASGKTTLLRAIAGLDPAAAGAIRFDGRDVTPVGPSGRDVGMVFQSPVLIGHMSARRNVSFPLDVRRAAAAEIDKRVGAEVRALRIEHLMGRVPATLSVGEAQMVQIARALVRVPTVLLLDEPFASLDDALRRQMRAEISLLQAGYGVTTVMTANDADDVRSLASMVGVLDGGSLVQWGATAAVRRSPATMVAATATGPIAFVEMSVVADRQGFWLVREDADGGETIRLRSWSPALAPHRGLRVVVGVRPEDVHVTDAGSVPARVVRPSGVGGLHCDLAGTRIHAIAPPDHRLTPGDGVRLRIDHHTVFDRETELAIARTSRAPE